MTDCTRGVLYAGALILVAVALWTALIAVGWVLIDVAAGWTS